MTGSRWRRLWRNPLAMTGLGLLAVLGTAAALAPLLPLPDPDATVLAARLLPPFSNGHPLGTDQLGRDILSRLLHGARLSLAVALFGTGVAALFGTVIGLLAAYYGRLVDALLMRGIDMLMAFPYLLLALAIVAVLGPGLANAAIAIAVVNVPFFARTVRGTAASVRTEDFIAAARLAGRSEPGIIAAELLPNVFPVILIAMSTTLGWMILETAGLSFLGLGAQPPTADLGGMLGQGRHLAAIAPHVTVIPGLVIFALAMSLNLLGDGLRDVLDPRAARAPRPPRRRVARAPRADDGEALLAVHDLAAAFGEGGRAKRVIEEISFDLSAAERVGIVGESGSGKSVTAQSILGLLGPGGRVVAGTVRYRGRDLLDAAVLRGVRGREIGFVPQDPFASLHPAYRIGEQIAETLRAARRIPARAARERAGELLEAVQIARPEARLASYPHELSGGMRQRVAIAIALANDPRLLIADEPTTALDVTVQAEILELLAGLCDERGSSLLFISHDFSVVSQLCSRVLVFRGGRIVESAPLARALSEPRHEYTRALIASVPRLGEPERILGGAH